MLHRVFNARVILSGGPRRRSWLAVLAGVLLGLIVPAGTTLAGPVAPDPVQLTQPDGTVIVAVPFGDEWYSGYEHRGYTIVLDSRSGFWAYARQQADGRLVPGPRRVGIDPPPPGLEPHLRDSQATRPRPPADSRLAPEAWPGALGAQKVLIILTDFNPSESLGTTDTAWNQLFFDTTAGAKTVRNFYRQASFDQFDLEPAGETYGTADDGVIAVTLTYAHPDPPSDEDNRLITLDALEAADPYIDYDSFDADGNGALDGTELHLMIIVRGFEESYGGTGGACTPNVWGHRGALYYGLNPDPPTLDGVVVAADAYNHGYSQVGEWHEFLADGCDGGLPGHGATMGIMVHEMGHDIDWPDLYDTDGGSAGVGSWSIMSGGSWGRASGSEFVGTTPVLPDAFLKWYQHWLTPVTLTAPQAGVAVLNAAANPVAYLLGTNPGGIAWDFKDASGGEEYFLVENRQQTGFDAGLWRIDSVGNARGCLIWHVDETRTSSNTANANPARRLVDVEEADGPPQDMDLALGGNNGDTGDPWPGAGGETIFGPTSDPSSNWYDGSTSGIVVSNISTAGTGCTLDFSGVGPAWDGSDSSSWNDADNWSTVRVPSQNDNTVIPDDVLNWPNVDAAAAVFNLNILDGAHLDATAGVSLDVYGNWTELGSGYFDAGAGTVTLRGTYAQTLTSGAGSHFHHLQIGSGSTSQTVTAATDLDVNGDLAIQAGARLAAGSHTIRVGGNWSDYPLGFAPSSGTVILDGTAQTVEKAASEVVVYSSDLSDMADWLIHNPNGGQDWGFTTWTGAPNTDPSNLHARYWPDTQAADDWLFSPGFGLQAGITYNVRFRYGTSSAANPEKLRVMIGTAQTVAAMTTQLFDNSNLTATTWQQASATFTPAGAGTYYVGFYCYSDANRRYPAIDDLVVAALDSNLAFYNLTVAGGSTSTLVDPAAVQNNLVVEAGGLLSLGTQSLTVEGTVANSGALAQTRTVNGASTAFLNVKNGAGMVDRYLGATIDPGSSDMGDTTVTVWGNQHCPTAGHGVRRCFELDPGLIQPATVTFYYTEAERNGADNATMSVYHWNGSAWGLETGETTPGGSGDGQWVRAAGIAAYSPFALNNGSPTAVVLTRFEGRATGDGFVALEWQTASEANILGFNVVRAESEAGTPVRLNDAPIPGQAPGSPTGGSYAFVDQATVPGTAYHYWIDVLTVDGTTQRHGPVRVTVGPGGVFVVYLPLVNSDN